MAKTTRYSDYGPHLEAMERDARREAREYADNGDDMQSMYQDGRADGIREALALFRTVEDDTAQYLDTKDRFIG